MTNKHVSSKHPNEKKETSEDRSIIFANPLDATVKKTTLDVTNLTNSMIRLSNEVGDLKNTVNARFEVVNARFDDVNARFDDVNARFEVVNDRIEVVNDRVGNLENTVNARFDVVNDRFEDVNARIAKMETTMVSYVKSIENHVSKIVGLYETTKAQTRDISRSLVSISSTDEFILKFMTERSEKLTSLISKLT